LGHGLVRLMPVLLRALSIIGTAAMLWVGGGIFSHGLEEFGLGLIPHTIHDIAVAAAAAFGNAQAVVQWMVEALGAAIVGIVLGAFIVAVLHWLPRRSKAPAEAH
ncbi:MAG TPA: DUF808 family protein, partial [Croceibacterium sp.]|nr:DUF808 family protein [Croceibacterium sp.]